MEAYNLTLESISNTLATENRNVPAGYIDIGSNSYSLRIQKEFTSAKEMENVIVGSFGTAPIYLRDVATVIDGSEERIQEWLAHHCLLRFPQATRQASTC